MAVSARTTATIFVVAQNPEIAQGEAGLPGKMIWVAEFYFGQVTSLLEALLPSCKRRSLNQMVLSAINESSRKLRGDMRSREEESEPLALGSQP